MGYVIKVQDKGPEIMKDQRHPPDVALDMTRLEKRRHRISITKKEIIFSIACWLHDLTKTSVDLKIILLNIESQLDEVHLYISDAKTCENFIIQGKCRLDVQSRSTIEFQVGLKGFMWKFW